MPCLDVNPKHSVRSKQEQGQHLCSALFMKVIFCTVLAGLRKEQHCGVQKGITWCDLHVLEVWGTEMWMERLCPQQSQECPVAPLLGAHFHWNEGMCWCLLSRVTVLVLLGFFPHYDSFLWVLLLNSYLNTKLCCSQLHLYPYSCRR